MSPIHSEDCSWRLPRRGVLASGLPGENHRRFTEPERLWTPAVRWLKQLARR